MTQIHATTIQTLFSQLHDGVSPHTYLGLMYLKKFTESLPENLLNEAQEQHLFLCFANVRKAHDNVEKIMSQNEAEPLGEALFFPSLEEVITTYGQGKILLEKDLCNMSSTISRRLGICLFELVLNQLKHNRFTKCRVKVENEGLTTYACIVFEGANALRLNNRDNRLGLSLMQQRLTNWGGTLNGAFDTSKQQVIWQLRLPNA